MGNQTSHFFFLGRRERHGRRRRRRTKFLHPHILS